MVLGDPHGDLLALDLVTEREGGPTAAFVSAGDNVGYADGPCSSTLVQALRERGVESVRGNHEARSEGGRVFLAPPGQPQDLSPEALAWCRALPDRLVVRAAARPGLEVHVVHTLPGGAYVTARNAERLSDLEEAQLTFCGHSHRPAIYTIRPHARRPAVKRLDPLRPREVSAPLEPEARYVVDAGSLARPARPRGGAPLLERGTYAVLDLAAGTLALRAVDKGPRLRALFARMLAR